MNGTNDIKITKALTREELKPCGQCGKGLMHDGSFIVYRVRLEQMVLDLNALRRQTGLEMMMGSPGIAAAFSPETHYACVANERTVLLCQSCAQDVQLITLIMGNSRDVAEADESHGADGSNR